MKVAAIDVGTNSIHLLIAEISPDGQISVIEKQREQVELGSGGLTTNRLTDDAIQRGLAALTGFKEICNHFDVTDITAAATSAVREAENGNDFVRAVRDQTDIHIRPISGPDEARLIYLGSRQDLDFSTGRILLFDLGGGSTEFILCDGDDALLYESVPLGHIRLADQFCHSDPMTEEERLDMKAHIREVLEPVTLRLKSGDFTTLVATSGAVRTLARMGTLLRGEANPLHDQGLVLRRKDLETFIESFETQQSTEYGALAGMDMRRSRTLPAGAILTREIFKAFGRSKLITSHRSLRDGLIVDWIIKHKPELDLARTVADPRRRSILLAMKTYGVHTRHARLVEQLAIRLFDATLNLHQLRVDDRRMLRFGALLHDIGHHIGARNHNQHSQYLITNIRMRGFTAPEIAVLGNLVRYHRGSEPKRRHPLFAALSDADRHRVKVLAGFLRLADAFDRSHNQIVKWLDIDVDDEKIHIIAHCNAQGTLERWAAVRRAGLLETMLNRQVVVDVVQGAPVSAG